MAVIDAVIARYQVKVIPVNMDQEIGFLVRDLTLQDDILCFQICLLQKLPERIVYLNKFQ